jgi:VIT1/CCC1 family predicted Fe2+/Mn2+ transporter
MAPEDIGNPGVAAATSVVMFAIGAIVPVLPWFITSGAPAIAGSAALAGIVLYLAGAGTTLFTGRSAIYSGLRMVLFGLAAAGITYGIGSLIGIGAGIS